MPKNSEGLIPAPGTALVTEDGRTNRNDTLTKEEFVSLLYQGEPNDLKGRQISGEVNLKGVKVENPVEIRNLVFTSEVNFSGARFQRGVDFTGCRFQKLNLSDARFEGPLILDKVVIGSETEHKLRRKERCEKAEAKPPEPSEKAEAEPFEPPVVANFTNLRVAGCLSMMNATVYGSLFCAQADIEDDFRIDEARVHGDLKLRRAHFGEFCTDAKQRIVSADGGDKKPKKPDAADEEPKKSKKSCGVGGALDLTSAKVAGDVRLIGALICGQFSLQTADINGNVLCRSGERVRTWLRNGAWLLGARIAGVVDFTACHMRGNLTLDGAKFGTRIDFSRLRLKGDAYLNDIKVENNLSFEGAILKGDAYLNNIKIENNVRFTGAYLEGNLLLENASIGGVLFLTATNFPSLFSVGDLDLSSLAVKLRDGQHTLSHYLRTQFTFHTQQLLKEYDGSSPLPEALQKVLIDEFNRLLRGPSLFDEQRFAQTTLTKETRGLANQQRQGKELLRVNRLLLEEAYPDEIAKSQENRRCEVAKKAWLLGATVTSDVDLSGVRIGEDLIMQNANVGQNLMVVIMGGFQSQIDGDIHLNGTRIRGATEFGGAILGGELDLDGASIGGGFTATFYPNDRDNWKVERARFGGGIHAASATIGKHVMLMGLSVRPMKRAVRDVAEKEQGVDFVGAQINGEFSLYSKEVIKAILQAKKKAFQATDKLSPEREREILAAACRERTEIEGDLRLTRTQMLGDVTLDGATINGRLDMRDANVRANINCKPIKSGDGKPIRAAVHCADFETLDMIGDMDLTGLNVSGEKEDGSDGDLILRDARIRGRLELRPPDRARSENDGARQGDDSYKDQITSIGGALRLNAAEISHAILTGDNLTDQTVGRRDKLTGQPADRGPSLWQEMKAARRDGDSAIMCLLRGGRKEKEIPARVELERAIIGRLQIFKPLPGTLDLSNLKVDSWDWPKDRFPYFNDMLKNSYPFRKSNYLAIEKALRNRGEEEQADEMHVLMRRRDRRHTKGFWSVLFDVILHLSINYGTTSKRLAWSMLVWFVISIGIFSYENHVQYDIAPLVDRPETLIPKHPENWSTGDAALLAARLHVPIISLGVEEKVQPSGIVWKVYAVTVVALSWVMWPLLIASAAGFIRKRE